MTQCWRVQLCVIILIMFFFFWELIPEPDGRPVSLAQDTMCCCTWTVSWPSTYLILLHPVAQQGRWIEGDEFSWKMNLNFFSCCLCLQSIGGSLIKFFASLVKQLVRNLSPAMDFIRRFSWISMVSQYMHLFSESFRCFFCEDFEQKTSFKAFEFIGGSFRCTKWSLIKWISELTPTSFLSCTLQCFFLFFRQCPQISAMNCNPLIMNSLSLLHNV